MTQINMTELCSFYGKNRSTIRNWISLGLPVMQIGGRGKETLFESTLVAEWLRQKAVNEAVGNVDQADEKELKREKLRAETTLAKIDVLKVKGEVLYIDEVISDYTKRVLEAKARLRNIPNRITPQIIGETDEHYVQERLLIEIDNALEVFNCRFVRVEGDIQAEDGRSIDPLETAAESQA